MTQSDINSTVLLTGPTSGIGAGVLQHLITHPARPHLLLLGRDRSRLAQAVALARSAGLAARGIPVDLADLDDVARAAAETRDAISSSDFGPISAALLNAGAQYTTRRRTGAQGWELTFTVNVIAQHLLLRELQSDLAPRGHVVLMGSSTHRGKKATFNLVPDPVWQSPAQLASADPDPTGAEIFRAERERGGIAYASSKLALVTLSHAWARQLAAQGARLNTYDPGLVAGTGLGRDMPAHMYWVWRRLMPAMRVLPGATSPANASRHAVQLALGDSHPRLHDGYVEIGRLSRAENSTDDLARQAELWDWLERATAQFRTLSTGRTSRDAGRA